VVTDSAGRWLARVTDMAVEAGVAAVCLLLPRVAAPEVVGSVR
jgi:hypothetical protein